MALETFSMLYQLFLTLLEEFQEENFPLRNPWVVRALTQPLRRYLGANAVVPLKLTSTTIISSGSISTTT
jgi:hypothetical protein